MVWSRWMDSDREREDVRWATAYVIPSSSGIWGQPMFTLKYTACEDMTREDCSCTIYDEDHKTNRGFTGIEFSPGVVWSKVMAQSDEDLMADDLVEANM